MYGDSKTRGERSQAQLGLSCLYDVLNRMILDSTINPGHYDLREQVLNHLKANAELLSHWQSILILDRGYPGLSMFLDLQNLGQKFVVRLGATHFKQEQARMKTNDEWLNIPIDTSRIRDPGHTLRATTLVDPVFTIFGLSKSRCQLKPPNIC